MISIFGQFRRSGGIRSVDDDVSTHFDRRVVFEGDFSIGTSSGVVEDSEAEKVRDLPSITINNIIL